MEYIKTDVLYNNLLKSIFDLEFIEHTQKLQIKTHLENQINELRKDKTNVIDLSNIEFNFYKALDNLITVKATMVAEDECERSMDRHIDSARHEWYNDY